ncbi:MAG: hypothetical protein FWD48_06620 [Oscillospiraceae bacterium]|nr:hypothetical protein [Oscillospiraceae bacterium]
MKKWLYLSIISFFISSMTIWFMPYESLRIILGGVFWFGLILGFAFLSPIGKKRKNDGKYTKQSGIILFRFFKNKPASIFDVTLIISAAAAAVSFAAPAMPQVFSFGAMFGLVFSLEMHGVFNGKNYEYYRTQ